MSSTPIPSDGAKIFAIAGAGNSTELMVDKLLDYRNSDRDIEVRILRRKDSPPKSNEIKWLEYGAKLFLVTYNPPGVDPDETLLQALDGVQVIISGIGIYDPFMQVPLANAALKAASKESIFIPFDYGCLADPVNGNSVPRGAYVAKRAFRDWLDGEGGWAKRWISIHTGWYMDEVLGSFVGLDVFDKDKKPQVTVWGGDGHSPTSWTARDDIASFTAYVLVHAPFQHLLTHASLPHRQNSFRIEGDRRTMNEIVNLVLDLRKRVFSVDDEIPINRMSSKKLNEMWKEDNEGKDFVIDMLAVYDQGYGIVDPIPGGNWREWWPEWNPKSLADVARGKFIDMK